MNYWVYILASRRNGTFYVGVTRDLRARVWQHKQGGTDGFTRRYGVHELVYYEGFGDIGLALKREKQLKKWNRRWKIRLIEDVNPDWADLYNDIAG